MDRPEQEAQQPELEALRVGSDRIVAVGTAIWCVALAVTLLVPALHEGRRDWWPWVCVTAVVGGAIAWFYVRRGRGNAESARR